jgi:hypothetical protein
MNVMTRVEAALFTCFSVGTRQRGVCPKHREGYEASISATDKVYVSIGRDVVQ